jgi:hypothetical protein
MMTGLLGSTTLKTLRSGRELMSALGSKADRRARAAIGQERTVEVVTIGELVRSAVR